MAKLGREYKATVREISICTHGLAFLCLAGNHINGGYISIVNFGVSAELSASDTGYNTANILAALKRSKDAWLPKSAATLKEIALELAEAINPYL